MEILVKLLAMAWIALVMHALFINEFVNSGITRVTNVVLTVFIGGLCFFIVVGGLGNPRPASVMSVPKEATLLFGHIVEDKAIYLITEDMIYRSIPYDPQLAQQLLDAKEQAEAQGTSLKGRLQNTGEEEAVFHAEPVVAPVAKEIGPAGVVITE